MTNERPEPATSLGGDQSGELSASASPVHRERRHRQEAPGVAIERFRSAYDRSPIGVALLDDSGCIIYATPALCQLLGVEESALLDRPMADLAEPGDEALVLEALHEALQGAPATMSE